MRNLTITLLVMILSQIIVAQEVKLISEPIIGQDVLIEVDRTFKGAMTIKAPDGDVVEKVNVKEVMKAVDKVTKVENGAIFGTRLYLKTQAKDNGRVIDGPQSGLEFEYKYSGGRMSLAFPLKDQFSSSETNKKESCRRSALTGSLKFPATMKVGGKAKINLAPIFPDLCGADDNPSSAMAEVTLLSTNEKAKTATFEGPFTASMALNESLEILPTEFTGTCSIVFDLAALRPVKISLEAKMTVTTQFSGIDCVGSVDMKTNWKAVAGKKATKARKSKVKFRNVPRRLSESGVVLTLPSYFHDVGENVALGSDVVGFTTGLEGNSRIRRVGIRVIPAGDQSVASVEQSMVILKEKFPNGKFSKSKTSAGPAQTMAVENQGFLIIQDFVAAKQSVLVVIHSFPMKDKSIGMKEVKLVRKSLGISN